MPTTCYISSFDANFMVEMARILKKSVNYVLSKASLHLCSFAPVCWFSIGSSSGHYFYYYSAVSLWT